MEKEPHPAIHSQMQRKAQQGATKPIPSRSCGLPEEPWVRSSAGVHRSSDLDSREVHKGCTSQAGPLRKTRPKEWCLSVSLSISLPTYLCIIYVSSVSLVCHLSVCLCTRHESRFIPHLAYHYPHFTLVHFAASELVPSSRFQYT